MATTKVGHTPEAAISVGDKVTMGNSAVVYAVEQRDGNLLTLLSECRRIDGIHVNHVERLAAATGGDQ
jgi:hypothetical protein